MNFIQTVKSVVARNRSVRVLSVGNRCSGEFSSLKSAARGQKSCRDNAAEARNRGTLRRLINPRRVSHFFSNLLLNFIRLIARARYARWGFFAPKFFRFPAAGQNAASKFRAVFIKVKCVFHTFILVPQPGSSVLLGTLNHSSGFVYTQI